METDPGDYEELLWTFALVPLSPGHGVVLQTRHEGPLNYRQRVAQVSRTFEVPGIVLRDFEVSCVLDLLGHN